MQSNVTLWYSSSGESTPGVLVPEVMQACGLDETDLFYLAHMNDAACASFQEIADVLNAWADKKEAEQWGSHRDIIEMWDV